MWIPVSKQVISLQISKHHTHLHKMSLESHSELMLTVGVGAVPQHQACQEEEEAWARFWDCPLRSWMATEGWQAGPEGRFRFCLLEVAVGEGLEQKTRHLLKQGLLSTLYGFKY